jgi:hypothetical protein
MNLIWVWSIQNDFKIVQPLFFVGYSTLKRIWNDYKIFQYYGNFLCIPSHNSVIQHFLGAYKKNLRKKLIFNWWFCQHSWKYFVYKDSFLGVYDFVSCVSSLDVPLDPLNLSLIQLTTFKIVFGDWL